MELLSTPPWSSFDSARVVRDFLAASKRKKKKQKKKPLTLPDRLF